MGKSSETLNQWLEDNSSRIANRFEPESVGDWQKSEQKGIALDLFGETVSGRATVWPEGIADIEVISSETGDILFYKAYAPFSIELLDEWLSELETRSGFSGSNSN